MRMWGTMCEWMCAGAREYIRVCMRKDEGGDVEGWERRGHLYG